MKAPARRSLRRGRGRARRPRRSPPIWLRRIDLVWEQLRREAAPRTAEEGLRQTAMLSAAALALLEQNERRRGSRDILEREARAEERWRERWKRERERFFRG